MKGFMKRLGIALLLLTLFLTQNSAVLTQAATARATTMKLDSYKGTVTVKTMNGMKRTASKGMRLLNGYEVSTAKNSEAYVNLDNSKAVKLAQNSRIQVRQSGKKLELFVKSGNVFFNVKKPLTSRESMNVRTSTMVAGVRGTSGYLSVDRSGAGFYLLEGKVALSRESSKTQKPQKVEMKGGQAAFTSGKGQQAASDIGVTTFTEAQVPEFVLDEVVKDQTLLDKINQDELSDLSVEKLLRVKEDYDEGLTKQEILEKFEKEQEKTEETVTSPVDSGSGFVTPSEPVMPDEGDIVDLKNDLFLANLNKNNGQVIIYGLTETGKNQTELTIPAEIGGYKVTSLASDVSLNGSAKKGVFEGCTNLRTVTITANLYGIPKRAFAGCTGLTKVILPESIQSVSEDANTGCSSAFAYVYKGQSYSTYTDLMDAIYGKVLFTYETVGSTVKITGLTDEGKKQTTLEVPDQIYGKTVTAIGTNAFYNCTNLQSIDLPQNLKEIGDQAFGGCSKLTTITLPGTLTDMGIAICAGCTSLKSVTVESGCSVIATNAFQGCTELTSVQLPDTLTSINNSAFSECSSLTTITLPASLEQLRPYVFSHCSSLTTITLPASLGQLESNVFSNCTGLTMVTLPDNLTMISTDSFFGCSNLKKFVYRNRTYASVEALQEALNGNQQAGNQADSDGE